MLETMNGYYDPEYLGKENYIYIESDQWPPSIKKKVELSYKRYNHYIDSSQFIKHSEISKFKKEWISNAMSLIQESMIKKHEGPVRSLFNEIFENYKKSMKEAILNYILLCPEERKRLNIQLLVKDYLNSA